MKKNYLLAMGLLLLGTSIYAQDKEAAKAEKAAEKEAMSVLKEAKRGYETSIPNLQYGRKETNFDKLAVAQAAIEKAGNNKFTKNLAETWKVAADINYEFFKKYDEQAKIDESVRPLSIAASEKVVRAAIKYDSLAILNPKAKEPEKKFINEQYRNIATNPLLQCLQAAQTYSNSETQEDLKNGYRLSSLVDYAFNKTHLFSTFSNEHLQEWKLYAKAFRAQSLAGIEGTKGEDIEAAYKELYGTSYETVAYSALINYYREKDEAKMIKILKYAYEHATGEAAPQFAFMYMQHLYSAGSKEECLKVIDNIVAKYPDNENTLTALLMKGNIMFENKKFDEAEKFFQDIVVKYPEDDRAIPMPAKSAWMKAQSSGTKADREHAIKLFKELEEKYPNNSDFWGEPLYILYNNNNQLQLRDKYKKYYKG